MSLKQFFYYSRNTPPLAANGFPEVIVMSLISDYNEDGPRCYILSIFTTPLELILSEIPESQIVEYIYDSARTYFIKNS